MSRWSPRAHILATNEILKGFFRLGVLSIEANLNASLAKAVDLILLSQKVWLKQEHVNST